MSFRARHRPETRAKITASLAETFARRRANAPRSGWTQEGSLAQRIRLYVVEGLDNAEIYRRERDVKHNVLRAYASFFRRRLRVPVLHVTLDAGTLDALQLEVAERATSAEALVARAMAALMTDPDLFDEILTRAEAFYLK